MTEQEERELASLYEALIPFFSAAREWRDSSEPGDRIWTELSIIADWYEDHGDPTAAEAMRWAIKNHKRPMGKCDVGDNNYAWFGRSCVTLHPDGSISEPDGNYDPQSDLPFDFVVYLTKSPDIQQIWELFITKYRFWKRDQSL